MPDDPSCQAPQAPTGAVPRTCVPFAHVPAVPVVAVPYVPVPVPSGLPVLSVSGVFPDRTGNVDVSQFLSSWAGEFAAAKADKAPPAVSGNLASLDASGNLADSGATPASIKAAAVAEVVANAPGTMDTLKEIADILGSAQQSGTVLKRILDLESGKVDKEAGKGLVAVDATLAVQGAAADAKAVGDALGGKASSTSALVSPGGVVAEGARVPNQYLAYGGRAAVDNLAVDSAGNLYVLDTIEWTLDGVAQPDIKMHAEMQYNAGVDGNYLPMRPSYGFGDGTGEMAVIDGYSIRLDFHVDENAVYSPIVIAYDSDGNFDHIVYGDDGDVLIPFDGKFSYSFEREGHVFAMRAKRAYSYLMPLGRRVMDVIGGLVESLANKVQSLSAQSTHAQYPSAKCVYDALAPKASASDLPYALVEPGVWEFSDGLSYVIYGPNEVLNPADSSTFWVYTAISDETAYYSQEFSTEALARAALSLTLTSGSNTITATRASLPGHLLDRAGNCVVVTGDTTLTLPAENPGYLRDFLVRLEISGSTVPTITFSPDGNESVTYETDGDDFPVPDEAGDWLYSFTESCVAHKFAVALKKVTTVAQGGS